MTTTSKCAFPPFRWKCEYFGDIGSRLCSPSLHGQSTSDRADRHRNWRARGTVIGDKDFAIGLDFDITNTYRDLMFYCESGF